MGALECDKFVFLDTSKLWYYPSYTRRCFQVCLCALHPSLHTADLRQPRSKILGAANVYPRYIESVDFSAAQKTKFSSVMDSAGLKDRL